MPAIENEILNHLRNWSYRNRIPEVHCFEWKVLDPRCPALAVGTFAFPEKDEM